MTNIIKFPERRPELPHLYVEGDNVFDFTDETRFYFAGDIDLILIPHVKYKIDSPGVSLLVAVRDPDGIEGYFRQFKGSAHLKRFIKKLLQIHAQMVSYEEKIKG